LAAASRTDRSTAHTATVHARDKAERRRVDVTAHRIEHEGIVHMDGENVADHQRPAQPRSQRRHRAAFERYRRFGDTRRGCCQAVST
jgi:hypothetical protein